MVTIEVQLDELPELSVTMSTTGFPPTLEQLKADGLTFKETMVQLSLEPEFTWEPVIVAVPALLRKTVWLLQIAFGFTVSITVTIAIQDAVFPLASDTETETLFAPRFPQEKEDGNAVKPVTAQLSVGKLAGGEGGMRLPELSRNTVILTQVTEGGVVSRTAILAEQVAVFPLFSVTIKTTAFDPKFRQKNAEGETDKNETRQLSVEPELMRAPVILPVPKLFRIIVLFWQIAIGLRVS